MLKNLGKDMEEVEISKGKGGVFEISVKMKDGREEIIWERKRDGGFKEEKVIKKRVSDIVWKERDMGN